MDHKCGLFEISLIILKIKDIIIFRVGSDFVG